MARVRTKNVDLIKKLKDFRKSYFTVADLEKVLDLKRESLYVTLNRLVKSGVLIRRAKNVYSLFTDPFAVEKIAG
jgi:predicted transcriptional regulator of viral defense system